MDPTRPPPGATCVPQGQARAGRWPWQAAVLAVVALALVGCEVVAGGGREPGPPSDTGALGAVIRIGIGPEQESVLVGSMLAELAGRDGFVPELVQLADGQAVRQALEVGDVDLAPGYTGQAWLEDLGRDNPPGDPRSSFQGVATADESNGILWLRPRFDLDAGVNGPPADATLALWVRPEVARRAPSLAELGSVLAADEGDVCLDEAFATRGDGWQAVAQRYSIAAGTLVEAPVDEAIAGVVDGECVVGLSTLTDGVAWGQGLVPLADPLEVFPAFVVSVQIRTRAVELVPTLPDALQPLPDGLTTAILGMLNARVQAGEEVQQVATDGVAMLLE